MASFEHMAIIHWEKLAQLEEQAPIYLKPELYIPANDCYWFAKQVSKKDSKHR